MDGVPERCADRRRHHGARVQARQRHRTGDVVVRGSTRQEQGGRVGGPEDVPLLGGAWPTKPRLQQIIWPRSFQLALPAIRADRVQLLLARNPGPVTVYLRVQRHFLGGAGNDLGGAVRVGKVDRGRRQTRRRWHGVVEVDDLHEDALGQLARTVRGDHLEAAPLRRRGLELELRSGTGLQKVEAPAAGRDAVVAEPVDGQGARGDVQLLRHIGLAGDLLRADGEGVVVALGVEAGEPDDGGAAGADGGQLVVQVVDALERVAAAFDRGHVDLGARWTCALRQHEAAGGDAAELGAVLTRSIAPVHVVVRDACLIHGTGDQELSCDHAVAQVHVALPRHGPWTELGRDKVFHCHVWGTATDLRRHLACGVARDSHEPRAKLWNGPRPHGQLQDGRPRGACAADRLELVAGAGDEVDLVVVHVGLISGGNNGDSACDESNLRIRVLKHHRFWWVERRIGGLEGRRSLKSLPGVDAATG
mmetsp:Transcript_25031/g.71799  ORF Transcript_25031/g.71799 Transcript_25031/m.71799 type:complete len:477 (-) Transcript_25031:244-1674(-)